MIDLLSPARLAGAIWGHLVGDAMGVPYELREPEDIGTVRWGERGTHGVPPGTWSDDGALMLALLDSLVSVGFDTADQGRRALDWYRRGAYTPDGIVFDVGAATSAALHALENGVPAEDPGATGERTASNGALMRILPITLWARSGAHGDIVELSLRAARVTHRNPAALVAAAAYSYYLFHLLAGVGIGARGAAAQERVARTAAKRASGHLYSLRPDLRSDLRTAWEGLLAWPETHTPAGRGGAFDCLWSAVDCFGNGESYADVLERSIRLGHDTDTTAAVAGGLAGFAWGIDGIPAEWLSGMRGHEVAQPIVDRLIASYGWKTSTTSPLRIDWVDLTAVPGLSGAGRLGMTILPGKQYIGWHGPAWRDLETDVARLRHDLGCDVLLLLVEDDELVNTRTTRLPEVLVREGIELVRHPVVDMGVPADQDAFRTVLESLAADVRAGKSVVVACRGGLGRTGTAVACLLVDSGLDADTAMALTRATRHETIERGIQVEWVQSWRPQS